jgi:hypothetical protein
LKSTEVFNYFLYDLLTVTNTNGTIETKRKYAIKVDMLRGEGTFGIRRCRQAEKDFIGTSCVIKSTSALEDESVLQTFREIEIIMKQSANYYLILFEYDLSACQQYKNEDQTVTSYYCAFHAVGANQHQVQLDYTWMINIRSYIRQLKEGQISQEAIFKD